MQRTPACPLFRTKFHPSQLCAIGVSELRVDVKSRLPKKIDALLKIINENPDGKFLIFSRYENPLYTLRENLETSHRVGSLQGNKDVIAHMLDDFSAGRTKILLLNSRNAAAGINIPMATHVILLHKMVQEEEKQILGRAYRMGRTEPLHFIKLLHERE
jgi:superfamily II DNA/RNA helicase